MILHISIVQYHSYVTPYLKAARKIPPGNQVLAALICLQNVPIECIDHQAGYSKSTIVVIYHKILDLLLYKDTLFDINVLPNFYFTTSETKPDY